MQLILILLIVNLVILVIKAANINVALTDANVYFYNSHLITQGKMIYKDFFYPNLPLYPYITAIYVFLVGKSIEGFYITSIIECILNSLLIYYIVYDKHKNSLTALFSSLVFTTALIVLQTSTYQTGVFTASLFSLLGYFFYQRKKYVFTGIFLALMVLTKAYYIPIAFAFFIHLFIIDKKSAIKFSVAGIITGIIIMLPTLLFAQKEFIKYVIEFAINRQTGWKDIGISYIFTHDFLLVIFLIWGLINARKNLLLFIILWSSTIFIFFYSYVQYIYLILFVPFISLSSAEAYDQLKDKHKYMQIGMFIILGLFALYSSSEYFKDSYNRSIFFGKETFVNQINQNKPHYLFGTEDIVPALSYLTNVPLLNNKVDTNGYLFNAGVIDRKKMNEDAIKNKTMIITYGIIDPMAGIDEPVVGAQFDKLLILKNCKLLESSPVLYVGGVNRMNLYKCF